jgi:hypothetical protein
MWALASAVSLQKIFRSHCTFPSCSPH